MMADERNIVEESRMAHVLAAALEQSSLAETQRLADLGEQLCRTKPFAHTLFHCIYDILQMDLSPSDMATFMVGWMYDRAEPIREALK